MEPVKVNEERQEEQVQAETGGRRCPDCGSEMRVGTIPLNNYNLVWASGGPGDPDREKILLNKASFMEEEPVRAFYCPDCKVVVLSVPEARALPDYLKKLKDGWNTAGEKLSAAWDSRVARREEAKRDKELEKRQNKIKKGKDPWEL